MSTYYSVNSVDNVNNSAESSGLSHPILQFLYYATIFTIPFYRWRHISEASPLLKVDWLLVMALGILVIPYLLSRKSLPESFKSNLWPWYGLFFSVNLISSLLSPYPAGAVEGLRILLLDFLFISINLIMVDFRGYKKIMPAVLISSVCLNSFLATLGYFGGIEYFRVGSRGIGGTIGANNAALMGIFVLPLIFHWLSLPSSLFRKLLVIGLLAIDVLGVVSTESRGGFLNMVVILGLIVFQYRNRFHPRYLGILVVFLGVIFLAAVMTIPKPYVQRIESITKGTRADVSTQRRGRYLAVGWHSFLENPILGSGTQTFSKIWVHSEESLRFERVERGLHNTYMEVLVGSGLVGLGLFVLLLVQALKNYNKAISLFQLKGESKMVSLTRAYRLAFVSVLLYFFFKSGINHKMFLLALPMSQIALDLARTSTENDSTL